MLHVFGAKRTGTHHETCQDVWGTANIGKSAVVCAISDGVSSAEYAELGAKCLVDTILSYAEEHFRDDMTPNEALSLLRDGFDACMEELRKTAAGEKTDKYAATLSCVIATEDWNVYGHSGDGAIIQIQDSCEPEEITCCQNAKKSNQVMAFEFAVDGDPIWEFGSFPVNDFSSMVLVTDGVLKYLRQCVHSDPMSHFYTDIQNTFEMHNYDIAACNQFLDQLLTQEPICRVTGDDKTIVVIVNDECAQTQSVQPEREIDAPETLETAAAAETCKEDSGCAEENPAPVETESDQETENEDNNAEQTEEKQGDFVKPSALVQQDNLEHTAAEAQENAAVPVSEQDIKEEHNIEDHAESRLEIDNQAVVPEENAHKNGEENTGPYTVEVQRYANTIVRFLRTGERIEVFLPIGKLKEIDRAQGIVGIVGVMASMADIAVAINGMQQDASQAQPPVPSEIVDIQGEQVLFERELWDIQVSGMLSESMLHIAVAFQTQNIADKQLKDTLYAVAYPSAKRIRTSLQDME